MLQDRVDIEGVAGLHGFQQGHLEKNLFGRGVAQPAFRLAQDLHHAGERIGAGQRGLFLEVRGLGLGDFEEFQITARQLVDEQIPKMIQQVRQQPAEVLAMFGQVVQFAQYRRRFASENGGCEGKDLALRGQPEHGENVLLHDLVAAGTDELIERGFSVAHGAIDAAGDGAESGVVDFDFLQLGDVGQMADDVFHEDDGTVHDQAEIERTEAEQAAGDGEPPHAAEGKEH